MEDDQYGHFDLGFPYSSDDEIIDAQLSQIVDEIENVAPDVSERRFKVLSEAQLQSLEDGNQSSSTKKNTKWALKMFNDWCLETGNAVDFHTISPAELADKLRQFYAVTKPKPKKATNKEFHRNSMKNLRAAINRHLRDIGRNVDIVRDREFNKANALLNGTLKVQAREGKAKPTQHKPIIESGDFPKIQRYLEVDTPYNVLYRCWYLIAVHFVSRGLEFHPQLKTTSFRFEFDDEGREYASLCHDPQQKTAQGGLNDPVAPPDKRMYACLCHDPQQKTAQGGLNDPVAPPDKRMYASLCHDPQQKTAQGGLNDPVAPPDKRMYACPERGSMCPVKTLKLLLEKSNPLATHLFCLPKPFVASHEQIWYTVTPLSKRKFQSIMPTISSEAGLSRVFTAHSLRATAITALNDAGVELRHIMFMSGHRNESSIRSYNRGCSALQKRKMSDVIQSTFVPQPSTPASVMCDPTADVNSPRQAPAVQLQVQVSDDQNELQTFSPSSQTINSSVTSLTNYSFPLSAGLFSRGVFNNCTFNFNTNN